jgi:hypothetical protein
MRRAYNYFFGSATAPPTSPTTQVTPAEAHAPAPSKSRPTTANTGVDTPPETPRDAVHGQGMSTFFLSPRLPSNPIEQTRAPSTPSPSRPPRYTSPRRPC